MMHTQSEDTADLEAPGRPSLNVDFMAVCDAVAGARSGSGENMTDLAARFGVSRGWLHK